MASDKHVGVDRKQNSTEPEFSSGSSGRQSGGERMSLEGGQTDGSLGDRRVDRVY